MNANLKKTMIALAVTGLFGTSMAFATPPGGGDNGGDGGGNGQQSSSNTHSSSVTIKKSVTLSTDVNLSGNLAVTGGVDINAAAVAVEDGSQSIHNDNVTNDSDVNNQSSVSGNVGKTASGNIGANVAAGDDNAQANAAALAATGTAPTTSTTTADTSFTFNNPCEGSNCSGGSSTAGGMADAEAFATQSGQNNQTTNSGTSDGASVSGNAFENSSGNVGVNVASGDDNEQLNGLAAATTKDNVYATATATTDQASSGNTTENDPGFLNFCDNLNATSNSASLSGNAFENASGNIGVNVAAGTGNLQANTLSMAVAGQ